MGTERWKKLGEAYLDDLTGILNKKFYLSLAEFIRGHSAILIIFDIDNFKYINDRYGHQTGDRVISEVGRMLGKILPSGCYPVRFGGDEFIAVFPDYNVEEVFQVAEKLRTSISSRIFTYAGKTLFVTCSFGIAPAEKDSIDEALRMADDALYAAKASGKNRTALFKEGLERRRKYIPLNVEREIRGDLAAGRSISVMGGFGSGKTLLLNMLKGEFRDYTFCDLDEENPPEGTKHVVAAYNPVMIADDARKKRYIFRLGRASYTSRYKLRNFAKNELINLFGVFEKECSLFRINYLDLVSSGNPMIASEFLSKEKLIGEQMERGDEVECLMSLLPEAAVEALREISGLGVRFTHRDISSGGVSREAVRCLEELMIIERRGRQFVYQYPEIYFKAARHGRRSMRMEYSYILETAEKLSDARKKGDWQALADSAESMYSYGDLQCASKILSEIKVWKDSSYETGFKVFTAQGDFEGAESMISRMADEVRKRKCKALLETVMGQRRKIYEEDDSYYTLLNMNICCRNRDFREFDKQKLLVDFRALAPKEMLSYLLSDAFAARECGMTESALSSYRHAERISLKNHFLADYGKIQMHLGMLYESEGLFERSMRHFRNALNIFLLTNQQNSIFSVKLNLANVYCNAGDFDSAESLYLELLGELKEDANSRRAAVCNNLADLYLRWWKADEALDYAERALEISAVKELEIRKDVEVLLCKICAVKRKAMEIDIIDYFDDNDIIMCLDMKAIELVCKKRLSSAEIIDEAVEMVSMFEASEDAYKTELLIFCAQCFIDNPQTCKKLLQMASERLIKADMPMRRQFVQEKLEEL